jgi:4a-hydroxytetrahydrobiopterin dehydratase
MKTFIELAARKCKPLTAGSSPLSEAEVKELAKEVPDWQVENKSLKKTSRFKDFDEAMAFVNRVADIARAEDHHPDICISYNKVEQTLTSHKIGGLSENDFIMAAKISKIPV